MPGIGGVLNIAQSALAAQLAGLNVTGQNIANVDTADYSREEISYAATTPELFDGISYGTGVSVQQVQRVASQMLDNSLVDQQSQLSSATEGQSYITVLENYFNEVASTSSNSGTGLDTMLTNFWNAWQDLSNNPTGAAERDSVYESGQSLAQSFASLNSDMTQMGTSLSEQISSGVGSVNTLTAQIAQLNEQIVGLESQGDGAASDQLDQRQALVTQLGQLIGVQSFQQPDGSLTVTTANGFPLIQGVDTHQLGTSSQGGVTWQNSSGGQEDISGQITGGQIGGWLNMKDSVLPKYESDLDAMAKQVIWSVNQVNSQGAGLNYVDAPTTGTYATDQTGNFSSLAFGNQIDYSGSFNMSIQNNSTADPTYSPLSINMNLSTAQVDPSSFSGSAGTGGPYTYEFTVKQAGTVPPTDAVNAPVLGWQKINSQGIAVNSGDVAVTAAGSVTVDNASGPGISFNIGAGTLVAGNTFDISTDATGAAQNLNVTAQGTANSVSSTYTFQVTSGGTVGTDPVQLAWSNGVTSGTLTLDPKVKPPVYDVDGMQLSFTSGSDFSAGSEFSVTTDANGTPSTQLPSAWHWTLDSFKDQFNRQANGISASVTSGNELEIQPGTATYSIDNIGVSNGSGTTGGETATVNVNNYQNLANAGTGTGFQLEYNGSAWTIANNAGYSATIVSQNSTQVNLDLLGTSQASDITVDLSGSANTNDTVSFDIGSSSGPIGYAFSGGNGNDSGVAAALGLNTFFTGDSASSMGVNSALSDSNMIAAAQVDPSTGELAQGDNSNALNMANVQYDTLNMAQWSFPQGSDASSSTISTTIGGYNDAMVANLGIDASDINQSQEFSQNMVNTLTQTRESLSGVSLDEEMVNMMKFQQAYAAAAQLVKTSSGMVQTLLASASNL